MIKGSWLSPLLGSDSFHFARDPATKLSACPFADTHSFLSVARRERGRRDHDEDSRGLPAASDVALAEQGKRALFRHIPQFALTVTVGEYQIGKPSPNVQTIKVVQVISNIAFSGTGTLGDIALLQLQRPLKYTPFILPICIPDPSTEFPEGTNCWVTGWGRINYMEPLPTPYTLQEVEVALISVEKCNELFNVARPSSERNVTIVDEAICAGYEMGGKDACQGDSGGPLVCAHNSSWFLVGIVSWGEGCAKPFRPGVYTRVTAYAKWLQRHIQGLQFGVIPVTLNAGGSHVLFLAGSRCKKEHSVRHTERSRYLVNLGNFQLLKSDPNAVWSKLSQVIVHNGYDGDGTSGDIALARLERPVRFTQGILPACLPDAKVQFPNGSLCWVTGWGSPQFGASLAAPKTLQQIQLPLIGTSACDAMYHIGTNIEASIREIQDDMICAGYAKGEKDACLGDSGGPLVCQEDGAWFVAGIVSWGDMCAVPNRPGVYTRVGFYQDWIKTNLPSVQFGLVNITYYRVAEPTFASSSVSDDCHFLLLLTVFYLSWTLLL
ncbi:hypothetical protein lerEdw1_006960 [Lerista edwardsae]|nr:hypothetical protein lerEdw1_006960 [Lerista edwardsae]